MRPSARDGRDGAAEVPTNYELRERIEAVSNASGGSNDLLTVAVTPDQPIGESLERVEEEHDIAEYVFDDLPGPVDEPVHEWDNEFDVDVIEAADSSATYGLLVVERGGAALGELAGDRVETVETVDSDVMGKTRPGGQSAQRFARDRQRQKEEFFGEVAEEAERAFIDGDDLAVDGLFVGATTVTVDEFTGGEYLDHRLRDAVVGTFSVEYASEQGLRQLAEKGSEATEDAEREAVREALARFREALRDEDAGAVEYGEDDVGRALEYGAVETLLVSGDRPVAAVHEYEERTEEKDDEVVVVPPNTGDGERFAETFGVAAILRFSID